MEKKDSVILVRCSSKDKEMFSFLAKELNVSLSTFVLTSAFCGAKLVIRVIEDFKKRY